MEANPSSELTKSDQTQISCNNINTVSTRKVMRIQKMTNQVTLS